MNMIPLRDRYFEVIDNVMYVFAKTITESGLSESYYRKAKSSGSKSLSFLDHPQDSRYSLVAFETMNEAHREKIKARFGNPYDQVARNPILSMVVNDNDAYQFYLNYQYGDNKKLPVKRVRQYTRAASWLNLLKKIEDSRNKIIKELGINVPQFYTHLDALVSVEKKNGSNADYEGLLQVHDRFPTSFKNIRARLKEYQESGYPILIDKMYGNQLAAKVNDELSEAHLLTLIEDPKQYDDVLVCMMYNVWAKKNNYKLIEPATVGVWRRKNESSIIMNREGNASMNEKFIRQVKGARPSSPLYLVEHDDNNLDFLFTDQNGYEFNKYVAIVVTDSFNDLVLGKSYMLGKSPDQSQVKHAYLDAMYYIRSLTGGWYMPFEIKADKWASKSLTPFYESVGKFIPPAHGNKHRGYIEQFFGSPHWKRSQKMVSESNNWSGNNMTAVNRGVNMEVLGQSAKDRPMIGTEAETQIENFFHLLRQMPAFTRNEMNAPSKEQQWLQAFHKLSLEQKRPISEEQFLLTFGIKHEPKHANGIRITNAGVEPQIGRVKLSYALPEAWMYSKYPGTKVNVIYDPFDMSRVLVTNYEDIRFIARTNQFTPRALKDQYTDSRRFLNAVLLEKKDQVKKASESSKKRKDLVNPEYFNAEALLQGGAMIKELKNDAEAVYIEQVIKPKRTLEERLNQM